MAWVSFVAFMTAGVQSLRYLAGDRYMPLALIDAMKGSGRRSSGPAEEFDRARKPITGLDLVNALQESPLRDLSFDRVSFKAPVRDVPL